MENETYLVAGCTPWVARLFRERTPFWPGEWHYYDEPEGLVGIIESIKPRYCFFPHWRWKVPTELLTTYRCVAFHLTDLPYGRGGSPLQNLIARGHRETVVTAFQMTAGLDEGPIYLKVPFSLEGLAEEIYLRATEVSFQMMREIVGREPEPVAQVGTTVVFKRRTPAMSEIGAGVRCQGSGVRGEADLGRLFDFLRMLDCEGYPRAFLRYGGYRYEFSRPALRDGRIEADVRITVDKEEG